MTESSHITLNIRAYDTGVGYAVKLRDLGTAGEVCQEMAQRISISSQDAKFYSLVFVTSIFSSTKKCYIHFLRSLTAREVVAEVKSSTIAAIMAMKFRKSADLRKLQDSATWYYKDIRSTPITFNDGGEIWPPPEFIDATSYNASASGGVPAGAVELGDGSGRVLVVNHREEGEEEEPLTSSDLTYLAKADRKGYLLKRSSRDHHLWRRWYCVLMDHLWCVDISSDSPKAIKVKLSGGVRYKEPHSLDGIRTILISASNRTHYFRCLNTQEQNRWIEELNMRSSLAADNNLFGMAEFIMNDEERAKSQRMYMQVEDVLETSTAYAVLVMQEDFSHALTSSEAVNGSDMQRGSPGDSHGDSATGVDLQGAAGPLLLESPIELQVASADGSPRGAASALRSSSLSPAKGRRPSLAPYKTHSTLDGAITGDSNSNNGNSNSSSNSNYNSSDMHSNAERGELLRSSERLLRLNVIDHFHRQSFLHHLHIQNPTFSDVLSFIIDVQKFKELYRHDLFVPENTQRGTALIIYFTYLLPQVQLIDARLADASLKALATILRNTNAVHPQLKRKLEQELSTRLKKHRHSVRSAEVRVGGLSTKSKSEGNIRSASSASGQALDSQPHAVGRKARSSRDVHLAGGIQSWGIDVQSIRGIFGELFGVLVGGGHGSAAEDSDACRSPHGSMKSHDVLQNSYILEKYGGSYNSTSSSGGGALHSRSSSGGAGGFEQHHAAAARPEDVLAAAATAAVVSSEKKDAAAPSGGRSFWPFFGSSSAPAGNPVTPPKHAAEHKGDPRQLHSAHKVTERAPPLELFDAVIADLMRLMNQ